MPNPLSALQEPLPQQLSADLRLLFIVRTIVCLALVLGGIGCLHYGSQMLLSQAKAAASIPDAPLLEGSPTQPKAVRGSDSVLFESAGHFKVTAAGFGAVVMASSLVPFFLAFLSRPTLRISRGGTTVNTDGEASENRSPLKRVIDFVRRILGANISHSRNIRPLGFSDTAEIQSANGKTMDGVAIPA